MYAIIDTETTGGNPAKDRIMEIAVILHDGTKEIDEFSTLVNPETPIAPFIQTLTGINQDMLKDAPTFAEIAQRVLEITDNAIFVAHNVSFDYGVVRNEFKKLDIRFERKQLCTVKLSREIMPDMNSYSLGKLCKEIGIEIEGRHRAYGDAAATSKLFSLLLEKDTADVMKSMLEVEVTGMELMPHISRETLEDLPEETGVYYFLDADGTVLQIGKSKNIRRQIIKDLKNKEFTRKFNKMLQQVREISYETTGSELVAQLVEIESILKHKPVYNPSRRRRQYRYGITHTKTDEGYISLAVKKLSDVNGDGLLAEFTTRKSAVGVLKRMQESNQLHPTLCGLSKEEDTPNQPPTEYNKKLSRIFKKYQYKHDNFFVVGEGRSHHEQSIVWVEDGRYKGYGFFEPEYIENDIDSLKESVSHKDNLPDVHRVIRNWLNKRNRDTIIPF